MKNNIGQTRSTDQEGSGPPWAVIPLEEEHNIVTRQW